jgi:hypothetical protein
LKELGKAKVFPLGRDDEELLIEALAPVDGRDEYRSIAFRESRIDYLVSFDDKLSGIVLTNGVTIPVVLPFDELKRRIYDNDFDTGGRIDLTLVTGKPVSEEKQLRLSKKFNPAAEEEAAAPKGVEITLFAHSEPSDRKFKLLRFNESDIAFFEPHNARKDKETYVALKPGCLADGLSKFYIAMPMHYFTYYLAQAKKDRSDAIDLTETTRPKDTASLKMD